MNTHTSARRQVLRAIFALSSVPAAALLAACGQDTAPSADGSGPAKTTVNFASRATPVELQFIWNRATKEAKGFTVGAATAGEQTKKVVVFFDPQCPHCGNLWRVVRANPTIDAQFFWIPVPLMRRESLTQAAMLLAADDAAGMMDAHEKILMSDGKGMQDTQGFAEKGMVLAKSNQALANDFKIDGVPFVLMLQPDGKVKSSMGGMDEAALKGFLGS